MMLILIIIIFLTHFIALILYPDTTFLGVIYLSISALLWFGFSSLFSFSILRFNTTVKSFLLTTIYLIMLLSIMLCYPQKDGKSVIGKIADEQYPDRFSLYRGFKQLGLPSNWIIGNTKKEIK
ncbi:MAG: hypothetical protein K6357_03635 [Elusimicrobiota bacterium]